jgi:hypothetical protein
MQKALYDAAAPPACMQKRDDYADIIMIGDAARNHSPHGDTDLVISGNSKLMRQLLLRLYVLLYWFHECAKFWKYTQQAK